MKLPTESAAYSLSIMLATYGEPPDEHQVIENPAWAHFAERVAIDICIAKHSVPSPCGECLNEARAVVRVHQMMA
jgi:hypothetical protein